MTAVGLVQEIKRGLLDLLFPPRCVGCRELGILLCDGCREKLELVKPPLCPHCGCPSTNGRRCSLCQHAPLQIDGVRSVAYFYGTLREAIHQLKYSNVQDLADPLGQLMGDYWQKSPLPAEIIVPVPLHRGRLRERGYNAREVVQEHSYVPTMWQRITQPDLLIYLDVSWETACQRRSTNAGPGWWDKMARRLRHARQHADVYISTDAHPVTARALVSAVDGKRHYEIFRGRTRDLGRTWTWSAVTRDSTADNLRPVVPAWNKHQTALLWLRGRYERYTRYDLEAWVRSTTGRATSTSPLGATRGLGPRNTVRRRGSLSAGSGAGSQSVSTPPTPPG